LQRNGNSLTDKGTLRTSRLPATSGWHRSNEDQKIHFDVPSDRDEDLSAIADRLIAGNRFQRRDRMALPCHPGVSGLAGAAGAQGEITGPPAATRRTRRPSAARAVRRSRPTPRKHLLRDLTKVIPRIRCPNFQTPWHEVGDDGQRLLDARDAQDAGRLDRILRSP
jgi:hypothetical protein